MYKQMSQIRSMAVLTAAALCLTAGCSKQDEIAETPAAPEAIQQALPAAPSSGSATTVVVEVGGVTLTRGQVEEETGRALARQGMANLTPEQLAQIKKYIEPQIIDRFVAQQVLMSEAKKQNITVSEAEKQEALDEIKSGLPEDVSLEDILAKNSMTVEKFTEDLVADLKVRKLVDNKMASVEEVTKAETRQFYDDQTEQFATPETVHARHILIQADEGEEQAARDEKKKLAEDLRRQLLEGADFAELAEKHSDCPSKSDGGDLGTFQRGRMVKAFEDAAFSQETNSIGPVVETDFGYHIIQVLAHDQATSRAYDEVKDDIQAYLNRDRKQKAVGEYIEELKVDADIRYAEPREEKADEPADVAVEEPVAEPAEAAAEAVETGAEDTAEEAMEEKQE